MRVAIDANGLVFLFDENANPPRDDAGNPLHDCAGRINYLVDQIDREKGKLIIPTPALSEILVLAGSAATQWLQLLANMRCVEIQAFDIRAAVECAELARVRLGKGGGESSRRKAKFDEQIASIAIVHCVDLLVTDDADIKRRFGERLKVASMSELALPPENPQGHLGI